MLNRRAVALIGGVSAAAVLAKQAEAGTAFTSFAFTTTGATTAQTEPNWRQQVFVNVKDFGAVGDGATNDTAAIQAAINYAKTITTSGAQGSATGSTVYFPPGAYYIGTPPLRITGNSNIGLLGAAPASSLPGAASGLFCNSSTDSVIAVYGDDSTAALTSIENLYIKNSNAAGLALRWDAAESPARMANCYIQAFIGAHFGGGAGAPLWVAATKVLVGQIVWVNDGGNGHYFRCITSGTTQTPGPPSWNETTIGVSTTTDNTVTWLYIGTAGGYNIFGLQIENCAFTTIGSSIPGTGSVGAYCGETNWYNCQFFGFDNAVVASGTGFNFVAGRFEDNGNCLVLGRDDLAHNNSVVGFSITGCQFESNDCSFLLQVAGHGLIAGNFLTGNAVPAGITNPHFGFQILALDNTLIAGTLCGSASYQTAGIDLSAVGSSSHNVVFAGLVGSSWSMPPAAQAANFTYINCDNPSAAFPFANLPASPVEGMEFNITDGTNGLGFGATATNTGTHTTHYKVRYNGTNWTVCGA